mgnify:FL=1
MDDHISVEISAEDCNELERRHFEFEGIREMLQDKALVEVIDNQILADRLLDRYVDAYVAYNVAWSSISSKYFEPPYTSAPKTCDFATRIVTLTRGD